MTKLGEPLTLIEVTNVGPAAISFRRYLDGRVVQRNLMPGETQRMTVIQGARGDVVAFGDPDEHPWAMQPAN